MSPEAAHEAVKPFLPLRQALARAAFKERYRQLRVARGGLLEIPTPATWPARIQAVHSYRMRDDWRSWQATPNLQERLQVYKSHKAIWH